MNTNAILKTLFFTPGPNGNWGLPVLFEGSPGVGKTSIIEQNCAAYGLPVETVIASLREPSDFLGLPVPTEDGLQYLAPTWVQRLSDKERGVAFLDELSTAAPAVQNALLRVVLDRYVGDTYMPHVRFVAAMNRVDETASGYDLAIALANRFIHLAWEAPTVQQWQNFLMGGTGNEDPIDAEAEEQRVLGRWDQAFAKARGALVGFANKAPDMIHVQPKANDPAAGRAWPSRRSWEMAARVLAGAEIHGLNEEDTAALLAGCVGAAAAGQYLAYQEAADMPDPLAVLDAKSPWKPDNRLDRTMAVLASCTALVTPQTAEHREKRSKALWAILRSLVTDTPDIVLPYATAMNAAGLNRNGEGKQVVMGLGDLLIATGDLRVG